MTIFDQKWPFFGTPPGGGVFDTFWHVTIVQIVQIVHNVCAYTRFRVYTQCVSQKCFCESQYFIKSFYFIKYFFLTRKKMPLLFGSLFFCSLQKNEHSTQQIFQHATFRRRLPNFSASCSNDRNSGNPRIMRFCEISQNIGFWPQKREGLPKNDHFWSKMANLAIFEVFALQSIVGFSILTKIESSSESEEFWIFSKEKRPREATDLRVDSLRI